MQEGLFTLQITRYSQNRAEQTTDIVAVEEPLKIFLTRETKTGKITREAGMTLRTPGNDAELALGFLFNEKIINVDTRISKIHQTDADKNSIFIHVEGENTSGLQANIHPRRLYASCGVCGQNPKENLMDELPLPRKREPLNISTEIFFRMKDILDKEQSLFRDTGGLHAAAIFDREGQLVLIREDIGRHNALDKIIGNAFLENKLSLDKYFLLLSGRAGFELVQKAAMAGIPVIASIGAPSSMAIRAAEESNISLLGFLRKGKFNIYTFFDNINTTESESCEENDQTSIRIQ